MGTLTIPLATKVRQVVVVESSEVSVRYLKKNLDDRNLGNIEILNKNGSLVIR